MVNWKKGGYAERNESAVGRNDADAQRTAERNSWEASVTENWERWGQGDEGRVT